MFYVAPRLDSFNKTTRSGHGTLMGNWNEERTLRDDTGEARTLGKSHITKKHEDLFLRPPSELGNVYSQNSQRDETFGRVFGRKQDPNYVSEQKEKYCIKFTKRSMVGQPTHGKKHELIQKQYLDLISQELAEKNKEEQETQNQRFMDTTYGNQFVQKNVGVNVIGKRVMRDQNGHSVTADKRDEDFLASNGLLNRGPLADEKDLQTAVKKESYLTAQPYTFWAEKTNDGAYYKSKSDHEKTHFGRNNEFLKTFGGYSHVKK